MESSPYTVEQYNEIANKAFATVKELLADADGKYNGGEIREPLCCTLNWANVC